MNETLGLINVESIELKQIKSLLYQLVIRTNNRDNCYVQGIHERREKEGKISNIDATNATVIITTKLTAIAVVDGAKIIKEYIDDINHKNERINVIANSRKKMLKMAIAVIFAKMVDD